MFFLSFSFLVKTSQHNHIGHIAHFGGALFGIVFVLIFYPEALLGSPLMTMIITVPFLLIYFFLNKKAKPFK